MSHPNRHHHQRKELRNWMGCFFFSRTQQLTHWSKSQSRAEPHSVTEVAPDGSGWAAPGGGGSALGSEVACGRGRTSAKASASGEANG